MPTSTTTVTPDLIRYMAKAGTSPVPPQVMVKAKHHILDTIAAMVSGTTIKPGQFALRYIEQQGGKPEAQVVGSRIVTSAINAAMANGMLAHADETDDSNGSAGIHPGCAVIPAALAMAERENAGGEAFLRAVILGYDIGSRTTKALGRDAMRARNHLPFSIGGTLGATAAAGSIARLSEEQCRHLLSCGAQQASGVMTYARDTEHIEKAFIFGGMTARNGVTAATLLQCGYTGVYDVFDGPGNFLLAYAESANAQELTAELGSRYEVMLTNIKKYCVRDDGFFRRRGDDDFFRRRRDDGFLRRCRDDGFLHRRREDDLFVIPDNDPESRRFFPGSRRTPRRRYAACQTSITHP